MTVCEVNNQKLIITLSNIEVISAFGGYEQLFSMTDSIKSSINALLREIIAEHKAFKANKIIAQIRAKKFEGLEITLLSVESRNEHIKKEYAFLFPDFESLINAVLKLPFNKESALYKTEDGYYLIIESSNIGELHLLNEFCFNKADKEYLCEYIREYGRQILKKDAIKTLKSRIKEP